jgi:hypothetical protein
MFHGYHDARRPLLRPCNNKGKTPASSGYKSQRMYCTREGGGEKKRERRGDSEETLEERQIEEGRDRRTKKTEGETIETGGRRERKTQKKNRGGRESSRTGGETQET